jgi:transposase, IS30 family
MWKYRRITYEDRCQIYALSKSGVSQESIAGVLGVSQSTVSREMCRNRGQRGYRFKQAEAKAQARQAIRSRPRKLTAPLRRKIEAKLRQMRWSPEQISGWLFEQGIKLSHERIYQMIWQDKRDGGDLWRSLRRRGKRYNKRGGKNAGRGLIPDRIDISERPTIVARKARLGDWEGDTVVSAGHKGGLLTLVERKTQLAKIIKLPTCDRPRNTKGSRASPQAYRRLRAHHHLRQRKRVRGASGHRPCPEGQNLLRHAVSRMGAWLE